MNIKNSTVIRYIGIIGIVFTVVIDRLNHPELLVFFGGLAGLKTVIDEQQKRNNERGL